MAEPNQPLHPDDAATLFLAGEPLLHLENPTDPFVYGRYFGQPVAISPLPFDPPGHAQAALYFTDNPVIQASAYRPPAPGEAVMASIKITSAGWSVKGTNMAVALQAGQSVDLTVSYLDADALPAAKPGPVTWASSNTAMVAITVNPGDDTKARASATGEGAVSSISAVSGAITANIDVSVGAGPAVSGAIAAGTPYTPVVTPLQK